MQAVLAFLKHIAISVAIFGHALLLSLVPQITEPAQQSPIGSGEPPTSVVLASSTSSVKQTTLFPVVSTVKPAQKAPSSSAPLTPNRLSASASTTSSATQKPPVPAPTAPITLLPQSVVNETARAALVNIFCTTKSGGYLYPISGSGVMITKNGVILTNAHVGQYFLLRDYPSVNNIDCRIRTGSPAQAMYKAELLYLPPSWVDANASQIIAQESIGTGENDYAFLRITSPISTSVSLPSTFPALTMTTDDPSREEPVLLASYPAGFLNGITIETSLYISTVLTKVSEIFAFNENGYADLMSLGGSLVAQAGSSGGAVVRQQDGALQGIIATETGGDTNSTASRNLHAITLEHIEQSLKQAGMGGIATLLTGDLETKAADFANKTAPAERKKLVDVLEHK